MAETIEAKDVEVSAKETEPRRVQPRGPKLIISIFVFTRVNLFVYVFFKNKMNDGDPLPRSGVHRHVPGVQ